MEPSTWNDENQHWLSQFLLKGFGQKRKASRVFQLDCDTGDIESVKVKDVASKMHLLSERDDGFLRGIETRAAETVDKIRKGSRGISEEDRLNLDALVWAMIINDPYHGADKEKARNEVVADVSQEMVEAFKTQGGIVDPGDMMSMVDETMNHDYLSLAMGQRDAESPRILRVMGLTVYQPPKDAFFVIGDSPVIAVRETSLAGPTLLNPGSQIILPIQHSCLLVYDWATPHNLVRDGGQVSYNQVHSLDHDYRYELKCRYLYGRTKESLLRSAKLRLRWSVQERSKEVQDGWWMMQYKQAELERLRNEFEQHERTTLQEIARRVVAEAARRGQPT